MNERDFSHQQYEELDWQGQELTEINSFLNSFIIREIIGEKNDNGIKIFDMGFGIGSLIEMLQKDLPKANIEGCEPSKKNYEHFASKELAGIKTFNETFLDVETDTKFDFVTAVYVFPHFASEELEAVVKKVDSMLNNEGKFVLVVANETYLKEKLEANKELIIEEREIELNRKKYKEVLHYSELPQIGTIVDCNREETFYTDLLEENGFHLESKEDLNDNDFICTVFTFSKN